MNDREAMQMALEIIGTHHRSFKHETTAREVMEMALEIMETHPEHFDYENQIVAIRAKIEEQIQISPADTQRKRTMTKTELLDLMWLLSALETAIHCSKTTVPDHVFEQIDAAVVVLKREILK